ncbi:MAG: hypothetical protein ABIB93_08170 [Chloroflexota bacterium]
MSEQLGKIERPKADEFKKGRKLFFVPLIFSPPEIEAENHEMFRQYWEEAQTQLTMLEEKLTPANKLYHELISDEGETGLKTIEKLNSGSYPIVRSSLDKGCELKAVEDEGLLNEFMDWGKCLAAGLHSKTVFTIAYESYIEAQKKRNERIAKQIDETLGADESGILLIREGHQVQFPPDIQVFYISPPALDRIRRWFREHETAAEEKKE